MTGKLLNCPIRPDEVSWSLILTPLSFILDETINGFQSLWLGLSIYDLTTLCIHGFALDTGLFISNKKEHVTRSNKSLPLKVSVHSGHCCTAGTWARCAVAQMFTGTAAALLAFLFSSWCMVAVKPLRVCGLFHADLFVCFIVREPRCWLNN